MPGLNKHDLLSYFIPKHMNKAWDSKKAVGVNVAVLYA